MSRIVLAFLIVTPTGLAHAQTPPFEYCPSEVWCKANVDDLADYCRLNPNDPLCPCDESTQGYKCYESSDSDSCWEFRCVDCVDTSDCGTCASQASESPCAAACGLNCCQVYGCLSDATDPTCLLGGNAATCEVPVPTSCNIPCDFGV